MIIRYQVITRYSSRRHFPPFVCGSWKKQLSAKGSRDLVWWHVTIRGNVKIKIWRLLQSACKYKDEVGNTNRLCTLWTRHGIRGRRCVVRMGKRQSKLDGTELKDLLDCTYCKYNTWPYGSRLLLSVLIRPNLGLTLHGPTPSITNYTTIHSR